MASYFDVSDPGVYETMDHGTVTKGLVVNNIVCMAVVALVITLRMCVRQAVKHATGLDDYLATAAAFSAIVFSSCCLFASSQGLGKHIWDLGIDLQSPSSNTITLRISIPLYVCYLSYLAAGTFIKCSILASYHRLFPSEMFRRLVLALGLLVVLTCISSVLVIIFECYPVQSSWDWTSPRENCIDILRFFIASSMISTITDIIIWGAPFPQFLTLQMKRRRKMQLVILFGIGAFAFVAGILRLSRLDGLQSVDITYTGVSPINWSVAEVSTAIVCASVPSLRPLAARVFPSSLRSSSVPPPVPARLHATGKGCESSSKLSRYWGEDIDLDDLESQQSRLDNTSLRSTTPNRLPKQ